MEDELNVKRLEKGIFIVLEGIDGSGKTTQASRLADSFVLSGIDAVMTREPTDGQWGRRIREIAKNGRDGVSLQDELEIFLKDREEHVKEFIQPALDEGRVVVCDRYYYSTMAYQGALGLDPAEIRRLNEDVNKFPKPDLVIMIEIEPWQGISRIEKDRAGGANAGYERDDFLKKVKAIFDSMPDGNIRRTPGMGCQRAIAKQISDIVKESLGFDLSKSGFTDLSCAD